MALTLGQVIKSIRDKHPLFGDNTTGNAVLARHLSSYQRRLVSKATELNRYFLVLKKTFYLPLPNYAAGFPIPTFDHILGATVETLVGTQRPVTITSFEDRLTPRRWPAAYVLPDRLMLMGPEGNWEQGVKLDFRYTPVVTDVAEMADEFTVPEKAEGCLVAAGAVLCARRAKLPAGEMKPIYADLEDEEKTFLAGVGHMTHPAPPSAN